MAHERNKAEHIIAEMADLIEILVAAIARCHRLSARPDPSLAIHSLRQINDTTMGALAWQHAAEEENQSRSVHTLPVPRRLLSPKSKQAEFEAEISPSIADNKG